MTDKYYNRVWNRHFFKQVLQDVVVGSLMLLALYAAMWITA